MSQHDEAERLRRSDDEFGVALAQRLEIQFGSTPDLVCLIDSDGSFPTVAGRYFKVTPQITTGTESEGQSGVFTAALGSFYALNIGLSIPTNGTTKVVCSFAPYRWTFEF